MDLLGLFLERYRNLVPADSFIKEAVSDVVFRVCGLSIDKKNIIMRGNKVSIKASPIIRNQIFLHKQKILRILSSELDKKAPQDIL